MKEAWAGLVALVSTSGIKEMIVKAVLAIVAWVSAELFGGWSPAMTTLIIFIGLDMGTGYLRAFCQKKASSKESYRGIAKKVFIFALVAAASLMDRLLGTDEAVRNATTYFFCANEVLSMLENAAGAGMPIPDVLKNALAQLNSKVISTVVVEGDKAGEEVGE